ncbi:MAG: DMT family transporter [Candidatus Adiutrix sp.]|jgi:drug/metabolite transporter (DMT)-like permease|nr:DMT family transporter [Candidatus Adiutrix sp.]
MSSEKNRGPDRLIYGGLVLTMAVWGGTFVAARLVSRESGPFSAAFWRFALAALVLTALTWRREGGLKPKNLEPSGWLLLALLGATGMFGYNYFFIKGLGLTEAGLASVIVAINPGLTYLGLGLFFREKLTRRGLAGFALAISGGALAISRGRPAALLTGGGLGLGELLIGGCVLCWAAYSLFGKMILRRLSPLMATTWACFFGLIFLAPAALWESGFRAFPGYSPTGWASLAFLGVFGTALGFTLYYQGILRLGAGRAAVFINLVPIFGILSGWLLLDESLNWSLAAGLVLVLSGIRLTQRP